MKPRSKRAESTLQDRRASIVDAARRIAEAEGWSAVTVRRLADAIEYSQPVLYSHFADGRDGIVAAVVVDGYNRLAEAIGAPSGRTRKQRLRTFIARYLAFARANPAVYLAMSAMTTSVTFAAADTPTPLRASFDRVMSVVSIGADDETRGELLWSAVHGMTALTLGDRLRPEAEAQRIDLLAELFAH